MSEQLQKGYPALQKLVHWVILFLVLGAYWNVLVSKNVGLHVQFGSWVLVFSIIRLVLHAVYGKRKPAIVPPLTTLQKVAATVVKIGLALCFIVVPVLAIIVRHNFGADWGLFGFTIVPGAAEKNVQFALMVKSYHVFFGYVGIGLIGLHSAAALFHHFVQKDNTLKNMLP